MSDVGCQMSEIGNQRGADAFSPTSVLRHLFSGGAIAQLGERLHGMQEVGGSIPPGSTTRLR